MLNNRKVFLLSALIFLTIIFGSLVINPAPSYAQGDLNAQLRTRVCSQDWGGAIAVVNQMSPLVPSNSPSQTQLINYRQQLQNLQQVNLRLDNWSCTPGQPIPALPSNVSDRGSSPNSLNITPVRTAPPTLTAAQNFWEGFLDIADGATARIGQSLGQERLRQYAASVCSTLQQGGSVRDVPAIATENMATPPDFQATLQEASVSAYCPAYINKLE